MAVAEPVEATNLLGKDTAIKTATTEGDSLGSEASPVSAMASTGSATADKTATGNLPPQLQRHRVEYQVPEKA
jgi:hypothetical protein